MVHLASSSARSLIQGVVGEAATPATSPGRATNTPPHSRLPPSLRRRPPLSGSRIGTGPRFWFRLAGGVSTSHPETLARDDLRKPRRLTRDACASSNSAVSGTRRRRSQLAQCNSQTTRANRARSSSRTPARPRSLRPRLQSSERAHSPRLCVAVRGPWRARPVPAWIRKLGGEDGKAASPQCSSV